jgi:hypothetical protein
MYSDCCGAYSEYADEIDLCPDCMEHCEFISDEDEEEFEYVADIEDLQNY